MAVIPAGAGLVGWWVVTSLYAVCCNQHGLPVRHNLPAGFHHPATVARSTLTAQHVLLCDIHTFICRSCAQQSHATSDTSTPACSNPQPGEQGQVVTSLTGETLCVRQALTQEHVRTALQPAYDDGIRAIAVVLKHSALFPDHEEIVGKVARDMGFTHVSLSSQVMKMVKMVPRGFTAAADAYLTPHIVRYLDTFQSGFDEGLKEVELSFMQSDGGLSPADVFSGHKAILSGPAAGYVGYAATTQWDGMPHDKALQVRTLPLKQAV